MAKAAASMSIEIENRREVVAAFKRLGNPRAEFLTEAMEDSASVVVATVPGFLPSAGVSKPSRGRSHNPRASFSAGMRPGPVKGEGANLRVTTVITHPGVRSYEFGRSKSYYTGFSRQYKSLRQMVRNEATGRMRKQFREGVRKSLGVSGQPARPFVGVLTGGGAIGASRPKVEPLIERAFENEARKLGLT